MGVEYLNISSSFSCVSIKAVRTLIHLPTTWYTPIFTLVAWLVFAKFYVIVTSLPTNGLQALIYRPLCSNSTNSFGKGMNPHPFTLICHQVFWQKCLTWWLIENVSVSRWPSNSPTTAIQLLINCYAHCQPWQLSPAC